MKPIWRCTVRGHSFDCARKPGVFTNPPCCTYPVADYVCGLEMRPYLEIEPDDHDGHPPPRMERQGDET